MARRPRFVLPGQPQHVIQRGDNRSEIFSAGMNERYQYDSFQRLTGVTRTATGGNSSSSFSYGNELNDALDQGRVPVTITVPSGLSCPSGTSPSS